MSVLRVAPLGRFRGRGRYAGSASADVRGISCTAEKAEEAADVRACVRVCVCLCVCECVEPVGRELWSTAGFVQMVLPDPQKIIPTTEL